MSLESQRPKKDQLETICLVTRLLFLDYLFYFNLHFALLFGLVLECFDNLKNGLFDITVIRLSLNKGISFLSLTLGRPSYFQ